MNTPAIDGCMLNKIVCGYLDDIGRALEFGDLHLLRSDVDSAIRQFIDGEHVDEDLINSSLDAVDELHVLGFGMLSHVLKFAVRHMTMPRIPETVISHCDCDATDLPLSELN